MVRHKYVQDCIVLKAKAISASMLENCVARMAMQQLCTSEEQYVQSTRQLEELPEEASEADRDKVRYRANANICQNI